MNDSHSLACSILAIGSTYSAVYFLRGGAAADDASAASPVGGRLALLPCAPHSLSFEQQALHVRRGGRGAMAAPGGGGALRFLLVAPTPGSCVVFPSFVPHFVIPSDRGHATDAPRQSFAFNFGGHDPVRARVHVASATGPPRVRLTLEAVSLAELV